MTMSTNDILTSLQMTPAETLSVLGGVFRFVSIRSDLEIEYQLGSCLGTEPWQTDRRSAPHLALNRIRPREYIGISIDSVESAANEIGAAVVRKDLCAIAPFADAHISLCERFGQDSVCEKHAQLQTDCAGNPGAAGMLARFGSQGAVVSDLQIVSVEQSSHQAYLHSLSLRRPRLSGRTVCDALLALAWDADADIALHALWAALEHFKVQVLNEFDTDRVGWLLTHAGAVDLAGIVAFKFFPGLAMRSAPVWIQAPSPHQFLRIMALAVVTGADWFVTVIGEHMARGPSGHTVDLKAALELFCRVAGREVPEWGSFPVGGVRFTTRLLEREIAVIRELLQR